MARISVEFPDPGSFAYDPLRPTYYTEFLSWATHKHQAALSVAGAAVDIETSTRESQASAVAAYGTSVDAWASSTVSALSAFLTGAADAQSPTFQEFPLLPDLISGAISLLPGGQIGLFMRSLIPFIKGYFVLREKLRPTDPVRILDMALLKSSWFLPGLRSSWLEDISDKLSAISEKEIDFSPLLPYLETSFEVVPGAGKVKLSDVLYGVVSSLTTQDCSSNPLSIADLLSMVLGACVPSGVEGVQVYRGLFDALEDLRSAISSISLDVETEKAVKVSLGSLITESGSVPYPSNM